MTRFLRDDWRRGRLLVVLALLYVSGAGELRGQSPAPPDRLEIDYPRGPGAPKLRPDYKHYHAYFFDAVNAQGKRWKRLVRASGPRHSSVELPALRVNEIVPLFGALYRVESPSRLVRLKGKDIPKGLAVQKDSIIIPLRRNDSGSGFVLYRSGRGGKTLFVTAIVPANAAGGGPVAQIKLGDIRKKAQEGRRGSVLQLGDTQWTVRAIVPADAQHHVLGWVELGPSKQDGAR